MYKYRNIQERVRDSLAAFRIVSLTGARQVGKTTLARQLCAEAGFATPRSALWLSMKTIGESLAGRTAILEMFPFRACEWRGGETQGLEKGIVAIPLTCLLGRTNG